MSFLDTIKRGAGAAVHGVQAVSKAIDKPFSQDTIAPVAAMTDGTDAGQAAASTNKGLQLPELDPKDPDYEEKKAIHDAFISLDQHFSTNVPNVDFQKEYANLIANQGKGPMRREMNPLSKMAIALGTQNPNNPWEPNQGLESVKKTEDMRLADESTDFEKALALKKEATLGHIHQLMQAGEFKKALSQSAALQDLETTRGRIKTEREQKNAIARIAEQNKGRANVASINAQAALDRESRRFAHAKEISGHLNLSPSDRAQMSGLLDAARSKFHVRIAMDPVTMQRPSPDEMGQADEDYRIELMNIQNYFDGRELGTRPPVAEPSAKPTTPAKSGATTAAPTADEWRAAARKQ